MSDKILAIIIVPLVFYLSYHICKDLSVRIPVWYKKWIKGECRHFCELCENYDTCKYELGLEPEYTKGYTEGYDSGYRIGKSEYKILYTQGWNDGYNAAKKILGDETKNEF